MQEDTSARFESELKIKALTSGIAELIGLAILLAYIISNITTVTENLEEESSIEAFDGIFSANSILLMNNESKYSANAFKILKKELWLFFFSIFSFDLAGRCHFSYNAHVHSLHYRRSKGKD